MFGVGLPELALIAFVAVLVFGPDKLPEFARQAGRFLRNIRRFATSARDDLRTELGPEFSDLELSDLDPRNIVRKHVIEAMEEAEAEDDHGSTDKATTGAAPRALAEGELPPYDVDAT